MPAQTHPSTEVAAAVPAAPRLRFWARDCPPSLPAARRSGGSVAESAGKKRNKARGCRRVKKTGLGAAGLLARLWTGDLRIAQELAASAHPEERAGVPRAAIVAGLYLLGVANGAIADVVRSIL